jgi:hypothetical protein
MIGLLPTISDSGSPRLSPTAMFVRDQLFVDKDVIFLSGEMYLRESC